MFRRLSSSSPIFGVCVRPWSTNPCGGGKESGSSSLMVDLALHDLGEASTADLFPNSSNLHLSLNSFPFVPSDFSSLALSSLLHFSYFINHPHLLLPLALDNTKLGNLIPSAPPWTIICPTKLGVPYFMIRTPRFVLGATANSICIIAYPDMKHLFLYLDFPWENLIHVPSTRTRLRTHVTHPVSLAPPSPRPPTNHIISEPSFNDPSSEYGVQYFHQPRTTPVGCYMTQVPQQNTFIRDINGANVSPSFSAWPTSSNVVDLDSPSQSHRSVPPLAYPILNDQNTHINSSLCVPEQVAPSNPIVATPAITNAMNTSDATGYTVPVSQAFATIMVDLNANQPLHFAVGSSSSPTTASTSGRRYKPKRPPSINEIEFHYFGSDHRPLILNLHQLQSTQRHNNRFFFDKLWLAEPNFEDCLTQAWSSNHQSNTNDPIVNLAEKLKHCSKHFSEWKKSLGPSISSKIREIQHTLKQSWHCRNEFLHHQKRIIPALMIQTTSDYLDLYQQNNMTSATSRAHPSLSAAAPHGNLPTFNLKLTVDAAQNINFNMTGFGMALYNNEGNMLLSVATPWTGTHSALLMEAHALTYALSWCHQRSIQPDLIVSDCKVLVDYICSEASHHLLLNRFAKEITNFLSYIPNAKLMHISREQNEMAHTLAKFALGLVQEVYWKDHKFICNL
ncbi:hypothetical protein G4B88_028373 [Cannabis sativa]|uniref:RNase H type-1 domain-containing protein n=1 Tax=Cannabis sativa TaxID=3483 RepID=A0A7J6EJI7_CANSA|nr:hypothetical protein G4B88_028373 [Cannabis sativa]